MTTTSARERFGIRLTTVSRRWRRALDHRLALAGHTDTSWAPLFHLEAGGDGLSQKDLAKFVGMEGSSMVRHLDRLESRGLVRRQCDPRDRRTKRIFLTSAGRDAVTTLRADLQAAEKTLLADLDDARLETLVEALEILDRRLQGDAEGNEESS
ncbi:MarR family winged helix-turn-helix transcriptional regulator [Halomonas sp. THAF12]|uniref:MarR family winged helix-turn-helix transcriptional regulator n=1 Tax=Halomonas sp. B23F22_10 TaxID=3459515 RepID=UPI00373FB290